MLHTAETRWFIPERLPDAVLDWFRAGQPIDSEGVQVHEYLLFPDCDSVGVKLRDGRLEIKAMRGSPQTLILRSGIKGRTEQWVKWSLVSEALQALDPALHQSGRWLKVRKERFLRWFTHEQGRLTEVTGRQEPSAVVGCHIEVTRIDVDADPRFWFSLGFEAFGPPALTAAVLDDALFAFFDKHGPVPGRALSEKESASYPVWLTKLVNTPSR
ncbi:MAG TPA: hypothetical protein VKF36_20865 [Syntrophorhabdales bacterium]|nr:hypothetical protein [Syntrophorhabdales bacterium]